LHFLNLLKKRQKVKLSKADIFIIHLKSVAEYVSKEYDFDMLILLSHSGYESGWNITPPGLNFFGIKAGKNWKGEIFTTSTYEFKDDKKIRIVDVFRKYKTPLDSFIDYVNLVSSLPRYKEAFDNRKNIIYFKKLYEGGYSTNPRFADDLISIYNNLKTKMEVLYGK